MGGMRKPHTISKKCQHPTCLNPGPVRSLGGQPPPLPQHSRASHHVSPARESEIQNSNAVSPECVHYFCTIMRSKNLSQAQSDLLKSSHANNDHSPWIIVHPTP